MDKIKVRLTLDNVEKSAKYSRADGGYITQNDRDVVVEVTINPEHLARYIALRAARSKSGKSRSCKYGKEIARAQVLSRPRTEESIRECPEIRVADLGTIVRLETGSSRAEKWLRENTIHEPHNWFGTSLCVEHRYAQAIIEGAIASGLRVSHTKVYRPGGAL